LKNGILNISDHAKLGEEKCKEIANFIHVEMSKSYKDYDKPKKLFNAIQSSGNNTTTTTNNNNNADDHRGAAV
jgi:hypothetical protein